MRWPLAVSAVLLAAFALRVHRLVGHNVWWDEGFSVHLARMPLRELVVRTAADVHPPVHYAFLRYWDRLVGESEYAIRYSTVLFGVLDLALLFYLARRYLGSAVALTAIALLAANRLHVEWSQQMRMYTLATALVLLSTACFLRLVHDHDRRLRWWLGHLALSVVGLHTIYVFGLAPLCHSIVVLLGLRRLGFAFVARFLGIQVAALALFVPWVMLFLAQPRPRPVLIYPIDLFTWLRAVYTALPIGISAHLDSWTLVTLVALALLLLPLAVAPRDGWLLLTAYLPLLVSPLLLYVLSYPNPVLYAPNLSVRYVLLFLPIYCALIALALHQVAQSRRLLAAAIGAAALGVCLWTTWDLYNSRRFRDEYRSIASFVHAYAEPTDAIVLYSDWDWPVAEYHLGGSLPRYGVGTDRHLTAESAAVLGSAWLARHDTLWLVTLNDARTTPTPRRTCAASWRGAPAWPPISGSTTSGSHCSRCVPIARRCDRSRSSLAARSPLRRRGRPARSARTSPSTPSPQARRSISQPTGVAPAHPTPAGGSSLSDRRARCCAAVAIACARTGRRRTGQPARRSESTTSWRSRNARRPARTGCALPPVVARLAPSSGVYAFCIHLSHRSRHCRRRTHLFPRATTASASKSSSSALSRRPPCRAAASYSASGCSGSRSRPWSARTPPSSSSSAFPSTPPPATTSGPSSTPNRTRARPPTTGFRANSPSTNEPCGCRRASPVGATS